MLFIKKILIFLAKLAIFVLIWLGLVWLYQINNQPQPRPANPNFFIICIVENGTISPQALKKYEKGQMLCQTPVPDDGNGKFRQAYYFEITPEQTHRFITYNDSPDDPVVYHYHVKNQEIIPIEVHSGAMMYKLTAWFYGLIGATILWAIGRFVRRKWLFRQPETQSPT